MVKRIDEMQENSLTTQVNDVVTAIRDLKSSAAQTSDSTSIIFYESKNPGTTDWTGSYVAPATSQTVVGPTVRVTVTSLVVDIVLLADVILESVLVNGGTPVAIYGPRRIASSDSHIGLWDIFIGVPLNQTSTVALKVSVVANTDVSISAAQVS